MTTCHFRNCPGRPSGSTIRPDGIELLYCVAHEAIARNLPPLRSAGCCASEGCGRPRGQRSPLCKSCRPRYSAWGLDGNIPAQEAPMTEPTITPAPADDGEPSEGDIQDAYSGRWGQYAEVARLPMSTPTLPPEPTDMAALAARGQPPTAPGPTVAELQQQLAAERARADLLDAEAVSQRQRAEAVEAELFELDHTLHTLGAHGTGSTKEWLLQVLTPEDRRNILEFDAAEARLDLARLNARARLNPAPPERVAELTAKVATLDARIAALDAG